MRDTKRAPDHSKDTPEALQKHWGTPRALQEPMDIHGTRILKGHLSNWLLKLFGHLGTQALRHVGTRSARVTLFGRLDPNFQWAASGHLSAPILFKEFRFLSLFDIFRHLFF